MLWILLTISVLSCKASGKAHSLYPGDGAVGLDIVLAVEEAGSDGTRDVSYQEYLDQMVPFRWYPYVPSGRRPSHLPSRRRPLYHGAGSQYRPGGSSHRHPHPHPHRGNVDSYLPGPSDHEKPKKPTILYLEGEPVEGSRPHQIFGRPTGPGGGPTGDRPLGRPQRPFIEQLPPLEPPLELFVCPDRHSCSDNVWERKDTRGSMSWKDRGCFCDGECKKYGDCCRDAPALMEEEEDGGDEGDSSEEEGDKVEEIEDEEMEDGRKPRHVINLDEEHEDGFVCRPVRPLSTLPSTAERLADQWYMLASCPPSFNLYDNKLRCEEPASASDDPLSTLPVTSGATNVTYSSLFCAMCHNDTDDLRFWQIGVRCPNVHGGKAPTQKEVADGLRRTPTGWGFLLPEGRVTPCEVVPRPPVDVHPRECLNVESRCPTGSPYAEVCQNHTAVVYAAGRAFKNIYCLLCAGGGAGQIECAPPCSREEHPAGHGGLRVRLQLGEGEDDRCGEKEMRDPFKGSCRSIVCSRPGFFPKGDECVEREDEDGENGEISESEEGDAPEEGESSSMTSQSEEDMAEQEPLVEQIDTGDTDSAAEESDADSTPDEEDLMALENPVDTENAIEVDVVGEVGTDSNGKLTMKPMGNGDDEGRGMGGTMPDAGGMEEDGGDKMVGEEGSGAEMDA